MDVDERTERMLERGSHNTHSFLHDIHIQTGGSFLCQADAWSNDARE